MQYKSSQIQVSTLQKLSAVDFSQPTNHCECSKFFATACRVANALKFASGIAIGKLTSLKCLVVFRGTCI